MKRVKADRLGIQRIDVDCARRANLTIEILFQGKWKAQILCAMRSGPIRLGQLARVVPGASKTMSALLLIRSSRRRTVLKCRLESTEVLMGTKRRISASVQATS